MPDPLLLLPLALAIDALVGDPDALWRRLPHPVVLIGRAIAALDRRLNRDDDTAARRRLLGVVATAAIVGGAAAIGLALSASFAVLPFGWAAEAAVAAVLLAQRSLYDHVRRVAIAFEAGGLVAARRAVARIVGRDPDSLDESGVCRAAIESTAENFSDGVVAPAFWFALAGLPGILAYKALNTADSMIGHRTARHECFGWAAARLDDLANLVPARLAGLAIALAAPAVVHGARAGRALRIMRRDAPGHRSPNAGWPEAAMAGALDLALAGPRRYGTVTVDDPWMGAGGDPAATPADIGRALRILVTACGLIWLSASAAAALMVLA